MEFALNPAWMVLSQPSLRELLLSFNLVVLIFYTIAFLLQGVTFTCTIDAVYWAEPL
jgi:hypothetical protein